MSPLEMVLLASAGLTAGGVNALAGGGSLVSFPALIALGLPPLTANVTNSVALWPGYLGTAVGYRAEIAPQRRRLLALAPTALLGAGLGCVLLLITSQTLFDRIVPGLVILGSLLLAVQGRVSARVRRLPGGGGGLRAPLLHGSLFASAAYGAYFGGGLGVVLLAVLGIFVADDLQHLNGLKNALALLINGVALVAFAAFGPVDWHAVAVLAPAALTGGFFGAKLARRLDAKRLRTLVVIFGLVVGLVLLARL